MTSILCATALMSAQVQAEIAVIVNPANDSSLDKGEISRIFLGKKKSFPNGTSVTPINLSEGAATRGSFDSNVLNKSSSQLKAYWSKLVFTGKGTPPKEVSSDADVVAAVKSDPSAIGYVDASAVTGDVKVVAKF